MCPTRRSGVRRFRDSADSALHGISEPEAEISDKLAQGGSVMNKIRDDKMLVRSVLKIAKD